METFPPHLTLPSPEVWGLCSWPGWEVGEAGVADLVFGKQWGLGVGSERELRDLGKRQDLRPGIPPYRTFETVYKNQGQSRRERSHQNQKLNSRKIFFFFFSKRQKTTNSPGPELPKSWVIHCPLKPGRRGMGSGERLVLNRVTLDRKALVFVTFLCLWPAAGGEGWRGPGLRWQTQLLPL